MIRADSKGWKCGFRPFSFSAAGFDRSRTIGGKLVGQFLARLSSSEDRKPASPRSSASSGRLLALWGHGSRESEHALITANRRGALVPCQGCFCAGKAIGRSASNWCFPARFNGTKLPMCLRGFVGKPAFFVLPQKDRALQNMDHFLHNSNLEFPPYGSPYLTAASP